MNISIVRKLGFKYNMCLIIFLIYLILTGCGKVNADNESNCPQRHSEVSENKLHKKDGKDSGVEIKSKAENADSMVIMITDKYRGDMFSKIRIVNGSGKRIGIRNGSSWHFEYDTISLSSEEIEKIFGLIDTLFIKEEKPLYSKIESNEIMTSGLNPVLNVLIFFNGEKDPLVKKTVRAYRYDGRTEITLSTELEALYRLVKGQIIFPATS